MTSIITIQKEKAFKDVLKINKNRKKRMTLSTETENCMKELKVVNITEVMIKLQFKLPQALISRGFTRRTVFHAPAFQQKVINRLMDIYQIWKPKL